MTKFNPKTNAAAKAAGVVSKTTNREGAPSYTLPKELDLYSAVVTSTLSNTYYEPGDERVSRIRQLVEKCDPEFVAKLAIYTREQMYLRSVPLVLLVELARVHSGDNLVSKAVSRTVQRADEIAELLAYYALANKRSETKKLNKLSKQIRHGLEDSFNRFDGYQFSKYDREGDISLKDALSVICPKAKDADQQKLFDKIMRGELEVAYTWETQLSELGKQKFETPEAKAAAIRSKWEELIDSGRIGYMALLRNLRNILKAEVSRDHVGKLAKRLADPKEVERSKQLPFRFLSAYRVLTGETASSYSRLGLVQAGMQDSFDLPEILEALEAAVKASVANIEGFGPDTKIYIPCDYSGSMQAGISDKSSIMRAEVGTILGQILASKCKLVITGIFGDTYKTIPIPKKDILANSISLVRRIDEVGSSTNGFLAVDHLTQNKIMVDKVMMFTDGQIWDSGPGWGFRSGEGRTLAESWKRYKTINPGAKFYLFDLAGHSTVPINVTEPGVTLISGWSEKIFSVLEGLEKGQSVVDQIKTIEL